MKYTGFPWPPVEATQSILCVSPFFVNKPAKKKGETIIKVYAFEKCLC
jgi:hypothetical protein